MPTDSPTDLVTSVNGANDVPARLRGQLPGAGMELVLDLEASRGSWLVDARTGDRFLDLYTFFASAPLGCNPPELVDDALFMHKLAAVAVNKPANSDLHSAYLAEFAETFRRVLGDPALPRLFLIEGGALAVENALKCAFDWKSRHNESLGRPRHLGTRAMHLRRAFHGRSGYTLSLTNTDPVKTDRFPTFEWPRIDVPAIRFPLESHLEEVVRAERRALSQAEEAFARFPHDIACFIAEPIQGEGGDNHMRPEFLQAMQQLCHQQDALFIMDEVQTGVGTTGAPWAYQHLGLQPDVVAFAKKAQVGGIMAGRRVEMVAANVFAVPGRISSTWGGGLVDMVRSQRYLEVIERDGLISRARRTGASFLHELYGLADRSSFLLSNVRGRGMMLAFDLPSAAVRDQFLARLYSDEHVIALPGGERSVRLRPALNISDDELSIALAALEKVVARTRVSEAITT